MFKKVYLSFNYKYLIEWVTNLRCLLKYRTLFHFYDVTVIVQLKSRAVIVQLKSQMKLWYMWGARWQKPFNLYCKPRCTHDISPHASWYPPDVLNIPRCTHDIPRYTHGIPPMYWISPDILNTHYTGCFFENRVFWYKERSKNLEKNYFITVQNNSPSWEGLTVETRFLDIEKSNSKRLFWNDSKCKTPEDSS